MRTSVGLDSSEIPGVSRAHCILGWIFLYVHTSIFAHAHVFLELQSDWLKAHPNDPILTQSPEKAAFKHNGILSHWGLGHQHMNMGRPIKHQVP